MKKRPFTIDECARHEAGHFIAALEVGFRCDDLIATVLDEPDADGTLGRVANQASERQVEKEEPKPWTERRRVIPKEWWAEDPELATKVDEIDRQYVAKQLIFSHAGAAAQRPRAQYSRDLFDGASKDMRDADEAGWMSGYWPPHCWDLAYFAAVEVVDARFGELMALARVLARRRRLLGPEMLEIVERAPKYRNPYRERMWWPGDQSPVHALAERLLTWREEPMTVALRAAAMSEGV